MSWPGGMQMPNARQQMEMAGAASAASRSLGNMGSLVGDYISRGPQGVTWLCFVGGLANIVYNLLTLIDIFDVLSEPITYAVCVYQMMFGLCTCMIEAPKEWERNPKLQSTQKFIHDHARFLTTAGGRGLFYLFQASLLLSVDGGIMPTVLGLYMLGIGVLCIAMQGGFLTDSPAHQDYLQVTGTGS